MTKKRLGPRRKANIISATKSTPEWTKRAVSFGASRLRRPTSTRARKQISSSAAMRRSFMPTRLMTANSGARVCRCGALPMALCAAATRAVRYLAPRLPAMKHSPNTAGRSNRSSTCSRTCTALLAPAIEDLPETLVPSRWPPSPSTSNDGPNATRSRHDPQAHIQKTLPHALSGTGSPIGPEASYLCKAFAKAGHAGHQRFALSGTPTDCVMMAGIHIMKDRLPDLVISGVNRGYNVANDVTYSGTVAAAMEGTVLGIPSVAMSQSFGDLDEESDRF